MVPGCACLLTEKEQLDGDIAPHAQDKGGRVTRDVIDDTVDRDQQKFSASRR